MDPNKTGVTARYVTCDKARWPVSRCGEPCSLLADLLRVVPPLVVVHGVHLVEHDSFKHLYDVYSTLVAFHSAFSVVTRCSVNPRHVPTHKPCNDSRRCMRSFLFWLTKNLDLDLNYSVRRMMRLTGNLWWLIYRRYVFFELHLSLWFAWRLHLGISLFFNVFAKTRLHACVFIIVSCAYSLCALRLLCARIAGRPLANLFLL